MHGQVLGIDPATNDGKISGADGNRYAFGPADWRLPTPPQPGQTVDFEPAGDRAVAIYPAQLPAPAAGGIPKFADAFPNKTKTAAGLMAIFLGAFGGHKFYLGYLGPAWIMMGSYFGGLMVGMFLLFTIILSPIGMLLLLPMAVHIVAFIEGIIYLTMTDQQFEATYVRGRKDWF